MPTRIITGWPPKRPIPKGAVVTIGVFDGVHTGHRRLIQATRRLAKQKRAIAGVITFNPDPHHVLNPGHNQPALMPAQERVSILAHQGLDWIWVVPFSRSFSRISAEIFTQKILIEQLHVKAVVVGGGFLFGKDREGTLAQLKRKVSVVEINPIRRLGHPISSTRIRQLIQQGKLAQACRLLGRPPSVYGKVVTGAGRGRKLGFPTANIRLGPQALPPQGVYAVSLRCLGSTRNLSGVMNYGIRPTFGPGEAVCEVHLLDFYGRLVGRNVEVQLIRRLRNERRFPSPRALQDQVVRDIVRARRLLASA